MVIVVIAALVLLAAGVALVLRGSTAAAPGGTSETITQIETSYGFAAAPAAEKPVHQSPLTTIPERLGTAVQRVLGTGERGIRKRLLAAGMYNVEPATIVGYRLLALLGALLLWIWVALARDAPAALLVLGIPVFGAIGWLLPMTYLNRRARERTERIERELPELIDLLVVTLEAGVSFLASLNMAAARLRGPLGEELRLALQEQRLGLTADDALHGMLRRAETPALRTFVRSVIQGESLGVSTGQIMRNLAVEMRKMRRARAEQRAQRAPLKMLFPLIFLIFPAMFIVLLGPAAYAVEKIFSQ